MKPKAPNQKKAYSELNTRLQGYSDSSELFLDTLNEELASMLSTINVGENVFRFAEHTNLNNTLEVLRNAFVLGLWNIISGGIDKEWDNAQKNVLTLIKSASTVYDEDFVDKYRTTASDAFKKRNVGGLTISQRLWKRYYDYKDFLEASISTSIQKGMNVGQIRTALTNDLLNIDALRFKYMEKFNSTPNVKDVKYYISRLVSSEINMAYRESEQQRWRQLDFVLGFKIHLSGNHKTKDICDELAGVYPKSFKWYGWHPLDRCYMTPVLMSDTDFWEWNNGGNKVGEISDVPSNFSKWMDENVEKWNHRHSLPNFITDNPAFTGISLSSISQHGFFGTKLGRAASKEAYAFYNSVQTKVSLSQMQIENINEIAKELSTTAKPMTFNEANERRANADFGKGFLFDKNCQCCVVVHEARLRGLNITSLQYSYDVNSPQYKLGKNTAIAWRTIKGKEPQLTYIKDEDKEARLKHLSKATSAPGRYHIGINIDKNDGHIITAERFKSGEIFFYDAQDGNFVNIRQYLDSLDFEVLKVDKLLFNKELLKSISRLL